MTSLVLAIAASSLAGSLHCVAMCGPLVGLHGGARSLELAGVHALGRLTTYATLGALAGLLGGAVDLAGRLAAAQHVAAIVAGGAIVVWGVRAIAVALGVVRSEAAGGGELWKRGLVQIRGRRAASRAWQIGVLTGLLPCGWLWAFVVSAAGTASPATGALVMAVFWLGTVPAMTGVLAFGGPLIDRIRRRMPVISACVLIGLGVATLAVRWRDAGATGVTAPHCHCHEAAS
ncbi:MAG TPA: sulfite exporter TauE/SafE family protein [Kofleriaceae bacterium]|nr:sulfite exporter TauE/SafE family protein [Kofleriaceae bacterium]